MKQNMGLSDRLIRLMIAAAFACLFMTDNIPDATMATILWVVGSVFAITSLIGFCPMYAIFGVRTLRKQSE